MIERDRKMLIPMIKEAFAAAGGPFKLFASPWSPPAWMKTTGQMNHGGKLKPETMQKLQDAAKSAKGAGLQLGIDSGEADDQPVVLDVLVAVADRRAAVEF